jgi:hypothetical protein
MTQQSDWLRIALQKANSPQPKPYVGFPGFTKRKVFVSFDYENDRNYKRLLEAWNKNPKFDFVFQDHSSGEINSFNVGRVKASLTAKISKATHTLVIVGQYANSPHKDQLLIGSKNWINFEIKQSKASGNKLVAVKLSKFYISPDELVGANAKWAMSFTQAAIIKALSEA